MAVTGVQEAAPVTGDIPTPGPLEAGLGELSSGDSVMLSVRSKCVNLPGIYRVSSVRGVLWVCSQY